MRINISGRMSIRKLLLLLLLIMALVWVGVLLWSQARPSEMVMAGNNFASALAKRDWESSYRLLGDDLTNQYQDDYEWAQWVNFVFEKTTGQEPKLVEEIAVDPGNTYQPEQQPTILVYEFYFERGAYELPLVLLKTDEGWRVNSIESFRQ